MRRSIADRIYQSKACQALFKEALDLYPGSNQSDEAADWILDQLVDEFPKAKWTDKLRTELYESIHAGLT